MEKLEARRDYLREWMERYKKAQDAVPFVHMGLEMTEWEIQALSNRPDQADEMSPADLRIRFERDYDYLTDVLPMMPEYNLDDLPALTAVITSGSASIYNYVAKVGDLGTQEAQEYSSRYTAAYRELQAAQTRSKAVYDLLKKLNNPQTLQRFDRASNAYLSARSSIGERTAAALEMRNLLDGVQGDLLEKARRWPKENMTWNKMAERLSKGKNEGTEQQELIDQETTRTSLTSQLSTVLKDREGDSLKNLNNVWTQLLDHIYVVLNLIDFDD